MKVLLRHEQASIVKIGQCGEKKNHSSTYRAESEYYYSIKTQFLLQLLQASSLITSFLTSNAHYEYLVGV